MNNKSFLFALFIVAAFDVNALEIKRVYHDPVTIAPEDNESVNIYFTLAEKAAVVVNIFDDRSYLVKKISHEKAKKGTNHVVWNGKDENDGNVPSEAYTYTITAASESASTEYDLSDYTGKQQYSNDTVTWNKQLKQFEYTLSKPSRVFVRVGLDNHGPVMATVLNWVARPAGKHTEKWDGMDASGVLDLAAHPKMIIDMQAYNLSDNTVMVGNKPGSGSYYQAYPWGETKRSIKYKQKRQMVSASQQAPKTRGDYLLKLKLPDNLRTNSKGLPVVSGIIPIVLDVDEQYRKIATDRRSEPVFYVDGHYATENEIGFLPMTWRLDTSLMNEGEHFLTVNLRGYEGNFGIGTIKVYVERDDG